MNSQIGNHCSGLVALVNNGLCSGCGCCCVSCASKAITMSENEYGELIPVVNIAECTGCMLCENLCPQINLPNLGTPNDCFAAWAEDDKESEGSSSGGIGYLLAREIIKHGGVVSGCVMNQGATPAHVIVESIKDLEALRGSKYVQSETVNAYKRIKELLKTDKQVLYIGTPCQVAGLRKYVGKNDRLLYTVDLVCHGVPPARYLREHLVKVTGESNFEKLSFREKNNFSLKVACSSGNFYEGKLSKDLYLSSFMHGDIYRSSCYECHYACQNRIGDLTIGDFWGLNRDTLVHKPPQAVSVILQNTNKGNELIQLISNYTILEKRKFVEAVKGNSQLKAPTVKTKYQTKFRAAIGSADFDSAIKKSGLARFFMINRIKASTVLAPLRALKHLLQGLK